METIPELASENSRPSSLPARTPLGSGAKKAAVFAGYPRVHCMITPKFTSPYNAIPDCRR